MNTDGGIDEGLNDGIRILSLDSGGPGAYSQLLILKEYMVRLASDLGIDEGDVYPADYFDLMGGVGFGGLVAILLGHLRMNVDEAIEALLDVALSTFPGEPKNNDPESLTRRLRESVESLLQTRGVPLDRKMQDKGEEHAGCKVALYATTTANLSHPVALRTYKPRRSSLNPTIVEAICATVATRPYFSPIKIGPRGRQQAFIGGPRGTSNPTRELLKEASALFGKDKLVTQIISVGCGRSHLSSVEGSADIEGPSRSVQEMAADCEIVAKELSIRLCDMDAYLRLDVERGLDNVVMHDWDDLGPILTHTSAYIEMAGISETIEASLRRLQGGTGTVSLGELNQPIAAQDVRDKLHKQMENLDRTSRVVKDNEGSRVLERLNPVNTPSYDEGRSCMKDTRTLILDDIVTWAQSPLENNSISNDSTPKKIFWLYGSPGLGKTSIANSLCQRLHESGNLGGSFFCRRDDPFLSDPNRVLPTLLYRLAWISRPYRDLVVQALRDDPNLNTGWTGCALLLKRLYSLQNHPRTVFVLVVDALDESGDPRTRAPLLKCISETCTHANWLKIVVISRPEHDIITFFQRLGLVGYDLSKDQQAHQDIRTFAQNRMASLAEQYYLPNNWPGESRLEQITRRSGGLFIFVETLYQLLDDPDPEPLLTQVLGGTLGEANTELHKLYTTAIETRIGRNKKDFGLFVQALVAVATHRSLPDKTLASLIGLEVRVISSWVDKLSSLLYRDSSENGGIRARHLSIIEFLTGPTCPRDFRVDVQRANWQLGHLCLITMTKELKFNICKLETSCMMNADIQDLGGRVQEQISDSLQYSCIYWSSHLCSGLSPASKGVSELLSRFLTGVHLLYWLEVLSLMGKVPVAISALRLMKASFKKFESFHRTTLEDTLRFVMAFFTPISTSTPHIYISGLPFMPVESDLWKSLSISFPDLLHVCKGRMKSWPAPSGVCQGHANGVHSIAYSPDGRNVVSGSSDKTIRIWDAETGTAVGEPLKGHTGSVYGVAYSPDGQHIVSGSEDNTVRIWDAGTGAAVGEPLKGHTGWVYDVAYSPDGRRVVSGSRDHTVRIWDAQTGVEVGKPLEGHTNHVDSVAYSPDGRNIISGSGDRKIRIWDAYTGEAIGAPLKGHKGSVWCVAYSPDGRNIVSGSSDKAIRFWDAKTGTAVGKPLRGRFGEVWSIAYSPDGQNVISGSTDKTIRIWDVETGLLVGKILVGHTGSVWSVAYSPDGQSVISGSADKTIRIWDAQTRAAAGEPLKMRTHLILSAAYSPDGRNIVSGSEDNTVQIWDAETGSAVRKTLKGHIGPFYDVAYSPDGRRVVSGSEDHTVRIWDVHAGVMVGQPLKGHEGIVFCVAYSPDGHSIVSGSYDKTIRIWDVEAGVPVGKPLRGHEDCVNSVAYSADGRNILSCSDDKTIRIWDVETRSAITEPLKGHDGHVISVAYSPDGRNIVSCSDDKTIRIWDVETRTVIGEPLKGHEARVKSVAYSPDSQNIVSSSSDGEIRIWDAHTGTSVMGPLKGHTKATWSVAYSPDGRNVISGSLDGTIRVWEAQRSMEEDEGRANSQSSNPADDHLPLTLLSDRAIPTPMLDSNGWVHGTEGLLFWVPEDCRHGLTCPSITTIPNTGRQKSVRIDFTRFRYGTSWTKVRGDNAGSEL